VRYFIYFSYNGKLYHGWQKQKNSVTVQEKIEESLTILLKNKIEVIGAGRTDTGVHAKEMVAHFDVDKYFENPNKLIFKLNQFLPNDISSLIHIYFIDFISKITTNWTTYFRYMTNSCTSSAIYRFSIRA